MIVANWGKYFGYCRHMLFRVQYIQFPRDSPGLFVVIYGMRPRLACRRIDDVRFILNANVRFDGSRCDTLCSQHHSGNSPDSTFLLLLIMEKVLLSLWRMPFRQLIACPSLLGLDSRLSMAPNLSLEDLLLLPSHLASRGSPSSSSFSTLLKASKSTVTSGL
jgi:hypothetical protein